ncbi:ChrR family anti-sigma-E factor [Photobacterium aphoticum]|uniref:Transcriptional activator ChrR n=1 Tax=Photobacterium aphoticum TaxID=754436 RepID=A0A0J1GHW9_9GAMM|nr:ChrR family anti-sigma-E factor [Photobacterium aphoticum]KLU99098.1 transcriptional activator ChrR [Photobacterium aphoticum]PSU54881.1 transcriptional activator ChrR [Photobacterium aphoticum]GHA45638.1 transcriptional regulator [Photobacterium aphoticum]
MTKVRLHPNDEALTLFASGDLDPASSIMISTHLEFCPHCRERVAKLETLQADIALQDTDVEVDMRAAAFVHPPASDTLPAELQAMMANIMTQDIADEAMNDSALDEETRTLTLGDQAYTLPRALQRHHEHIGPWSKLPGNIKRAHVAVGGNSKMNFIYMDSNSALPEHTHQGQEITLVLAGEFHDENGTYRAGDFVVQTATDKHVPRTHEGQDCLCLTLLDAPLHFTSGLATLLNPFSQLFFRQ